MAVRTPGFMERMARLGLGIVEPYVGVTVLAQVLSVAWNPLQSRFNQSALFTGMFLIQHPTDLSTVFGFHAEGGDLFIRTSTQR